MLTVIAGRVGSGKTTEMFRRFWNEERAIYFSNEVTIEDAISIAARKNINISKDKRFVYLSSCPWGTEIKDIVQSSCYKDVYIDCSSVYYIIPQIADLLTEGCNITLGIQLNAATTMVRKELRIYTCTDEVEVREMLRDLSNRQTMRK